MILFDTPGIIEHKRTKLEERMMSAGECGKSFTFEMTILHSCRLKAIHACLPPTSCAVVNSIQNSEAIIAVVDASDQPKEALAMFQPGRWAFVRV